MSNTGVTVFDTSLQKTNQILKGIEEELGWQNRRNQSYQALRTVLHALRDRLPVNESVHLAAQLPLILRGVYYEDWNPDRTPVKMDRQEFIQRVAKEFPLDVEGGAEKVVRTVLTMVFSTIDPGETMEILNTLPPDFTDLFSL